MKKFIISIMCVFGIATAYAENENAATSKEYVDTGLATKQPTIPAQGNNVVMTFDSTATDGIGTKDIYDETASYAVQTDALVTAGTANSAVQMAINGEFECVLYDPDNPTDCWWWNIKSAQRLPAGYTELEYLESTGAQYIDTEITPTANFEFYIDASLSASSSYIFATSDNSIRVGYYNSTTLASSINDNWNNGGIAFGGLDNKFHIGLSPHWTLNYNGNKRFVERPYSPSGTARLFPSGPSKIYSAELYDGKTLVFHLIPTKRNSDGVLGMYDTVSGTFFTNAGTGTFIAGPVASYLPQNQ